MDLKKELEVVASWFSILVAASYTFTIGYIDVLKIPVTPSPAEAFSFYLRATLLNGSTFAGFFRIFGPLFIFIGFAQLSRSSETWPIFQGRFKRVLKNALALVAGVLLIWAWCFWQFNQGRESLETSSAASNFPEAYRSRVVKDANPLRLAWISDKKYFWLECDKSQPQLIGIENEKEFYVRRLGPHSGHTVCSSSN